MNDPKGGVAKVTCPTFEAMGQISVFHRTYFLLIILLEMELAAFCVLMAQHSIQWTWHGVCSYSAQ